MSVMTEEYDEGDGIVVDDAVLTDDDGNLVAGAEVTAVDGVDEDGNPVTDYTIDYVDRAGE